ncbi:MAG: glycosyltransferase family 2 protein [Cyanobacteria bacterium J06598_1]
MLNAITPVILTYNEAPNIERTLEKLTWASQIVVVDSYSTDDTLEKVKAYPQVKAFHREFDTHAAQWNYGLAQVSTGWVLSLDADYVLSDELIEELTHLALSTSPSLEHSEQLKEIVGYFVRFRYCVMGKPLKGSILPPRQVLFKRDCACYIDDGHTQLLSVKGVSATLERPIFHDDRKPLSRWIWAQERYMVLEAQKLLHTSNASLSFGDKLRKRKVVAPFVVFLYCLFLRGGIFDGWRGCYYAFQRMFAETLLSLKLIELSEK